MSIANNIKALRNAYNLTQEDLAKIAGVSDGAVSQWEKGETSPRMGAIERISQHFGIPKSKILDDSDKGIQLLPPTITSDTTIFPVIGEIAAGYDKIGIEDWSGETVEIPRAYLKGHKKEEFFVLQVQGNSMYPLYQEGDKVLILRQSALSHSGEIGAVLYDDEMATLKKVEYVEGEHWLRLVPINPDFMPRLIENDDLEHCRIIGVPKLLIRDLS